MSYQDVNDAIEGLPHFREFTCLRCGHIQGAYVLTINAKCKKCGETVKLRGFAAVGSEVEDVVDQVLAWLGKGDVLDLALDRKKELEQDIGEED